MLASRTILRAAVSLCLGLAVTGCASGPPPEGGASGAGSAGITDDTTSGRVTAIESPAAPGSGEPGLAVGLDGRLYLSWIEPGVDAAHALRFSVWEEDAWSSARTIAEGDDWFVNWADVPSMAALNDGTLAAHWLAKVGASSYAYGIRVAVSRDGGRNWSRSTAPHRDGTATEHGFVSLVPSASARFDLVWLDGRAMQSDPAGAMMLRHTSVARDGSLEAERLLDDRVCDCCPTDATRDGAGSLIVLYRDRTPDEIRDISLVRLEDSGEVAAVGVHADGWKIAGCPVNGPAVAADGRRVVATWFTGVDAETGRVLLAVSDDGGRSFGDPIRIDLGAPLGRVDLVLTGDGSARVAWLERLDETAALLVRDVDAAGRLAQPIRVATTGVGRSSGFPRLAHHRGRTFVAWTEAEEPSRVLTARIHDVAR